MNKEKKRAAKPQRRRFKQNILALVYDFDGTLVPKSMQEYTVLPELGVSSQNFWKKVTNESKKLHADQILTYMRLLLDEIERSKKDITRESFRRLARGIEYFPGIETWFDRINAYVRERSKGKVKIRHYIISAGLKEILEGISIKKHFHRIYACEYFFDHHHVAKFPIVVINDTTKTQFLFRINKGRENIPDSINEYMPEEKRAIPFDNIVYIGDGLTDVPCMTVTKKAGGHSIAVYRPSSPKALKVCKELAEGKRIDYFAPADYSKGKKLESRVKVILDLIIARVVFAREKFSFHLEMNDQSSF